MPHACSVHNRHELVGLRLPEQMANEPIYLVYYPCACGFELCIQPVVVNGGLVQAMRHGRMNLANPSYFRHQVQNRHNSTNQASIQWLEYPTYPEVQPRLQSHRRNRTRSSRKVTTVPFDSDNESDVDR